MCKSTWKLDTLIWLWSGATWCGAICLFVAFLMSPVICCLVLYMCLPVLYPISHWFLESCNMKVACASGCLLSICGLGLCILVKVSSSTTSLVPKSCQALSSSLHVCFCQHGTKDMRLEWSGLTLCPSKLQEANSYKIAVRPERRRQFHRDLVASVQKAFDLLSSCLSGGSVQVREQVC